MPSRHLPIAASKTNQNSAGNRIPPTSQHTLSSNKTTPHHKTVHKFQTLRTIFNQFFQFQAQSSRISPKNKEKFEPTGSTKLKTQK